MTNAVNAILYSNNMTQNIIIYYDGTCSFCHIWCIRIKKFLFLKNTKLIPIQDEKTIEAVSILENSWIIKDTLTGEISQVSSVVEISERISFLFLIFYFLYTRHYLAWRYHIYTCCQFQTKNMYRLTIIPFFSSTHKARQQMQE